MNALKAPKSFHIGSRTVRYTFYALFRIIVADGPITQFLVISRHGLEANWPDFLKLNQYYGNEVISVTMRFLGTHNPESKNAGLASFLIDDILAMDAGSLVSELTFPEQRKITAILLSHGRYDHIRAVPRFCLQQF